MHQLPKTSLGSLASADVSGDCVRGWGQQNSGPRPAWVVQIARSPNRTHRLNLALETRRTQRTSNSTPLPTQGGSMRRTKHLFSLALGLGLAAGGIGCANAESGSGSSS